MSDVAEERKKSASTISDAEIIDPMESELTDNESVASTESRRSSVSTKSKEKVLDQLQEDIDAPLYGADALNIEPKQLTEAEYEAIYTPETRAKAFVLLLYFSVLLVIIPFGSMYICYYHVFNNYDSSTDMLYSGIVAIVEVYLLVALFIFFAYKDEQSIEKRVNDMDDIIPVFKDKNVHDAIKNLLAYSVVILLIPLGSMFLLKMYIFEGFLGLSASDSTTYSAIIAVILVHVVLIFWLIAAFKDGKPKKPIEKKD